MSVYLSKGKIKHMLKLVNILGWTHTSLLIVL